MNTPLLSFLLKHTARSPVSFHMPGHKGAAIYRHYGYDEFLDTFMNCDVTEIPGADNLFQTEGVIKKTQQNYADLYEVDRSYLLINGTSGGIIASILASVKKGRKLIMARNCHKSVFNALTLGEIEPVYAYPNYDETYGISGEIPPSEIEQLLEENHDADAVILPSPNYYGICSDIKAIAEIVHRHGKTLIVDQAHGAHLKFFPKAGVTGLPLSAEASGADLVINSTHKTLASLTQSAVLNVKGSRIDRFLLEDKLQAIESTSPSYVLMASLDINAAILAQHGKQIMNRWAQHLNLFYEEAAKIEGLTYIDRIPGMDWTKINFSMEQAGISGDQLEQILIDEYDIFIELFTGNLVMCMTGIGTTASDIRKLLRALAEISEKALQSGQQRNDMAKELPKPPVMKRTALSPIPKERKLIPLSDAHGSICASSIIPYPPGIPFICPGERLDHDAIEYIKGLRSAGEKVIGVTETGEIFVGKD